MLEALMKGLAIWLYGLFLEIVEFIADSLLQVFNMDLAYFEANVPVTREIMGIILAAGWALLIGNLVFQAMKSMMSGIGFEGEDPKILFCRTFIFGFLLLASRQICEIGLGITRGVNTLLQTPDAVRLGLPPLDIFAIPGSWLLVMIMGIILMIQVVKFFFEVAERYVVLAVMVILAPLAFAMGGSKNTEDIFKGWARMFGASCLMMIFNTAFIKLLLSAMSSVPSAAGMIPWMLFVVAIAKVARRIDDMVARIGLNVARTGEPLGRGGLLYPIMVMKSLGGIVAKTAAAGKAPPIPPTGRRPGGSSVPPPPPPPSPSSPGAAPSGGGVQHPHPNGGTAAPSNTGSGTGSTPPAPATPGTQPSMSAPPPGTAPGITPPPSRPPTGQQAGRNQPSQSQQSSARDGWGNTDMFGGGSSRGSGTARSSGGGFTGNGQFGGRGGENPHDYPQPRSGGGREASNPERENSQPPPLSVNNRTPDIPGTTGETSAPAGNRANAPQRFTPGRKVNIDIVRDDDPAGVSNAHNSSRPAAAHNNRPATVPPPNRSQADGSQSNSHADTRSTRFQRKSETSTVNTANAANAAAPLPSRASSPSVGRVGGVTTPREHAASGGATASGSSHRPTAPAQHSPKPSAAHVPNTARQSLSNSQRPAGSPQSPSNLHNPSNTAKTVKSSSVNSVHSSKTTNTQEQRPARYKVADRRPQQKGVSTGQDSGQAGIKPTPGRPAPDKPPVNPQSPRPGTPPTGGNRP